jgi:hypothetical protein
MNNANTNTNTINYNAPTLATSAILVTLSIGTWSASKKDKRKSEELTQDNHAAVNAAEVRKKLLPDAAELEECKKIERQARLYSMGITMTWNDDGQRLLPMAVYTDYVATLANYERDFWDAVNVFIAAYTQLRYTAQSQLGDLFNAEDYPDTGTVRSKFKFGVDYAPVPESGHFVVDLQGQAKDELIEQFNARAQSKWSRAFAEVCEEFRDCMQHLLSKVEDKDGDKQTRLHSSLIPNIRKIVDKVRMANALENNADVTAAVDGLERVLSGVSVDALKTNEGARIQVREGVNNLLSKFDF